MSNVAIILGFLIYLMVVLFIIYVVAQIYFLYGIGRIMGRPRIPIVAFLSSLFAEVFPYVWLVGTLVLVLIFIFH